MSIASIVQGLVDKYGTLPSVKPRNPGVTAFTDLKDEENVKQYSQIPWYRRAFSFQHSTSTLHTDTEQVGFIEQPVIKETGSDVSQDTVVQYVEIYLTDEENNSILQPSHPVTEGIVISKEEGRTYEISRVRTVQPQVIEVSPHQDGLLRIRAHGSLQEVVQQYMPDSLDNRERYSMLTTERTERSIAPLDFLNSGLYQIN